jgi:hypothetical protein
MAVDESSVLLSDGEIMKLHEVTGVTFLTALLIATTSIAQEKKIKRSALPPSVEATVAAQSSGATIKGFTEEKEKGETFYEAEMLVNGRSKDILIDVNGAVVEVEQEVAMGGLPADVRAGLTAKAANAKITKIETITKKGRLVAYEAQLLRDGKKSELQVGPHGKPLDHEE